MLGSPDAGSPPPKGGRELGAEGALGGAGDDDPSPREIGSVDGGIISAGTTPRIARESGGDGDGNGGGDAAQPDGWLPGLLSLRPLSARGGGGYEALRSSDGGSAGSSPTAAGAASASLSPRSASSPGPASPPARDGTALLRQLLGAGGDAWRRRRLPRALSYRYCFGSISAIMVAYASREADVKYDLWCMPRSWFQLHSVWHVMAALVRQQSQAPGCSCLSVDVSRVCFASQSLWSLWVFMRSEAPSGSVPRAMRPLPPLRLFGKKARTSSAPISADGADVAAPAGLGGASSPRGASLVALGGSGVEMVSGTVVIQPLSARAASIKEDDESAPVGVPAAAGRSAAHLRTRSREVFNLSGVDGRDMV